MNDCTDALRRLLRLPGQRTLQVDRGYKRWDLDEYSWGGPTAIAGPNVITRAGTALRQPIGPIHWAGTESAIYWQGYMDGAVTAGYRSRRRGARSALSVH